MRIMFDILGCFIGMLLYFAVQKIMYKINSKKQHTFIYCPACKTELMKNGKIIKDEEGIITYKCIGCGYESRWDIAHYPCPVWIDDDLISY